MFSKGRIVKMARAMTANWFLPSSSGSCHLVACTWILFAISAVLVDASHNTDLGNYAFGGSNGGGADEFNEGRCPWACSCSIEGIDCSLRGLTQVPGDLSAFLEAQKL